MVGTASGIGAALRNARAYNYEFWNIGAAVITFPL
jgi:hypothetical protein